MDLQQIEDIYALSPLQQGLLFHSLYEPESSVYVEQISWQLHGSLNISAFTRAWQAALDRHPILRTAFLWKETDKPVQMVFRHVQLPMKIMDWSRLPKQQRVAQFDDYLATDRRHGFDPDEAPLMRLTLIQCTEHTHYFIWSHHHLLLDGWSVALLLREVFMFYQAFCRGETLQLAACRPFRDYIAWLQKQDMLQAEAYWRKILQHFSLPARINIGRPKRVLTDSAQPYQTQHCLLSKWISDNLQTMVRQEKLTLNTLVQGAWSIMLSRYSGQQEVLYGYAVSGRSMDLPGVESMIGLFINTLPARVQVPADKPLLDWLHQLQQQQTEANQYHYTPLSQIQAWSDIATDQPFFESILGFENYPLTGISGNEERSETSHDTRQLTAQSLASFSMTHYPLSIIVVPGHEMEIRILYDSGRFDKAVIDRLLAHYQTVLAGMCASRQQKLADVPMLSSSEHKTLMDDWNDTALSYAKDICISQLVEHQAAQHPESVALICGKQQLSYQRLNERSNQLAHYLQSLGIGPDKLVGILMSRSIDMIVAQLSVLKAGGAYVPFDAAYPKERLVYMLQDSQALVLLTEQALIDILPEYHGQRICLDSQLANFHQQPSVNPNNAVKPTDLAYVIYTSGSTGKPKGVEIEQAGLANLVHWHLHTYHIDSSDQATQLAGPAFDASVWEIWPYLVAGASLHIVDDETRGSPGKLLAYYAAQGITYSFVPTPLAEAMLAEAWPPNLALKALLTGGDTLHQAPTHHLPCQLVNHYGPTESTVVTTWGIIDASSSSVPPDIGRPIANTQVYILDSLLRSAPIGVAGELCIGGDSLARGYHNRPELTQEKFIINPCKPDSKQRIYRTGDLARYLEDGRIEFLGRLDSQVKLRGYRIELGEIETLLDQHTGIQQAAVMQQDTGNEQCLVAYVASSPDYAWNDSFDSSQASDNKQISHWLTLYDDIYAQEAIADPDFNIIGWNSSISGLPIPEPEMREWVANTVSRLDGFNLDRVLEIGCGTGLLLWRIASRCHEYMATDFSQKALAQLHKQLAIQPLPQVSLLQRAADDFQGIDHKKYDTVILNSVVQYFPSIDYLREVLAKALRVTAPGGIIFIGDVRNLQLLEAFHAAVEFSQASASVRLSDFKQRLANRISQERELLIAPAFFYALKNDLPQISQVFVQLKRGHNQNEMTCYRYDVTLVIGAPTHTSPIYSQYDWSVDSLSMAAVQQILQAKPSERVLLTNVPNARLSQQFDLLDRLANDESDSTVDALHKAIAVTHGNDMDPEAFWALAENLACHCHIAWSNRHNGDCYDVLFEFNSDSHPLSAIPDFSFPTEYKLSQHWQDYANQPLRNMTSHHMAQQLRTFLQRQLPEYMVPSKFVFLDALPLNPNGKIDRRALPAMGATRLDLEQSYVAPRTPVEQALVGIWSEVLGIERVGIHDNFFELGGDSIVSIQLVARAHEAALQITPKQIFEKQTIAELAAVTGTTVTAPSDQQLLTGEVLLMPIQQWFFEQDFPDSHHFNQTLLLKVPIGIDERRVEQVLRHLLIHHDALRLRFSEAAGVWKQYYSEMTDVIPFTVEDLTGMAQAEQSAFIESQAMQWQGSLDLSDGPLVRLVMFKLGAAQPARLLFIIHHLLVDGVSWRILLEDFTSVYGQLSRQQLVALPAKTTSLQFWSEKLTAYAQSITLTQALPYFQALSRYALTSLPVDYASDDRSLSQAKAITLNLDKSQSQILLMQLPKIYHVQINDILLTALLQTLANWTGVRQQLIDLEGHGREPLFEDVDLSRTVGWFTTICPVLLELAKSVKPDEALLAIKEQLHATTYHGLGYGLLRYLHNDPVLKQQLAKLPQAQISFNYMGQFRAAWASTDEYGPAPESVGSARSLQQNMSHLLEVNAQMADGCLEVEWTYLANCFKPTTVQSIAEDYMARLRLLVEACQSADQPSYTPSDFPDVQLSQDELDQVIAEVDLAATEDN